ncbi:glutamate receptor-like [Cherax quadricarinatus]|uniref:glutamate receptor-like n=1 Tax=Cherax quadricarinatus TaxID=27406 RepID=UPI00387EDF22
MLDAIAEMLNFRYTMTTKPQDCMWGSFVNGSWNGILGMVHRKEKNFTVNTMLVTEARGKDFDFGVWYWMEGFGVMLMNPAPLAKWRGIYYSFQPSLWFAVILTAVSVIVIMTLQDRIQPEPLLGGLGGTWMYMLRTLVNQELTVLPRAQWQRLFLASWLFYCFILTTAYIANLIAFVTTPVFPERLHTLHQLAHSNYRLAMVNYGDFVPEALRSSKSDEYTRLWRKLDLCQEYNEVLALMTQQTHAFVELYSYSKVLLKTQYQLNHTYMMKEQLYPSYFAWLYPKNTAWRYKFDQGVRHLVEAGLVSHWYKEKIEELLGRDREKWERVEARQQRKKKGPLNLHHLEGVFFILVISWAASAVVLLLELLFHSSLTSTASSSLARILMI